jgi:DNA-binding transcriptional regulator YhcF (GntR family)
MEMENRIIEVRDIWDGDWYWIQRVVFEDYTPKIGVIGLALYNAYSSYARDKGIAFPSQKTLAEKLGLSIKTVIKYNRILEANGLIRIERRKGKGKTNLVTLLKVGNVNQFHAHPVTGSVKVVKGVQTKENNMKENKIKESTKVDAKASPIDVVEYFKRRVRELKEFEPEIDYGKDGRLAKERLKKYSFNEIRDLIDWYLNSEHFEKFGASLSICLSNFIVNLWKAGRVGQRSISSLYPLWQGGS